MSGTNGGGGGPGRSLGLAVCVVLGAVLVSPAFLGAFGEIQIGEVTVEQQAPDRFFVRATVTNTDEEAREVILRAQITFYDRLAPKGDLPVAVLRKDLTEVLKAGESRPMEVLLFEEGTPPKGAFRLEPEVRIRRNRVWHY